MDEGHKTTRTSRANWKAECESFVKERTAFKVIGITKEGDEDFLRALADKNDWGVATGDKALYLFPRSSEREGGK